MAGKHIDLGQYSLALAGADDTGKTSGDDGKYQNAKQVEPVPVGGNRPAHRENSRVRRIAPTTSARSASASATPRTPGLSCWGKL